MNVTHINLTTLSNPGMPEARLSQPHLTGDLINVLHQNNRLRKERTKHRTNRKGTLHWQ